jgi:hypothetical protein
MRSSGEHVGSKSTTPAPPCEILTAGELAERWRVPESWVREQTRSRCVDVLPHIRLGRYIRFCWNSPELNAWWKRRQVGNVHEA